MCQRIKITVMSSGVIKVFPTECDDGGKTCRDLSGPFARLGRIVDDVDRGTSHVIAVAVDIKDVTSLDAAAEACDLIAVATTEWDWYGSWANDYSSDDAAYRNGFNADEYGKCEFALVQRDSPLGIAELAARANGRRLTHDEAVAIRQRHYGDTWRTAYKPYSVGVVKNPNGVGFKLVYDFWRGGHGLRDKIGDKACKLVPQYVAADTISVALSQGHKLASRQTLDDGTVQLEFTVKTAKSQLTI